MPKFRKKPVVIEASQWLIPGDHPAVKDFKDAQYMLADTSWYDVHRSICTKCKLPVEAHGWVGTLEGGHVVCPADWIITGVKNEKYNCKPDIFKMTYSSVDDEEEDDPAIMARLLKAHQESKKIVDDIIHLAGLSQMAAVGVVHVADTILREMITHNVKITEVPKPPEFIPDPKI